MTVTNQSCDYTKIQTDARKAATTAGVNLSSYLRHVFAFPFNSTCQFAGLVTVGGNPSSVWINGSTNTGILAHEFGHTPRDDRRVVLRRAPAQPGVGHESVP